MASPIHGEFWTPARLAQLRAYWRTKRPVTQIAALMGCTVGACCGKAHRLGLKPKPQNGAGRFTKASRAAAAAR